MGAAHTHLARRSWACRRYTSERITDAIRDTRRSLRSRSASAGLHVDAADLVIVDMRPVSLHRTDETRRERWRTHRQSTTVSGGNPSVGADDRRRQGLRLPPTVPRKPPKAALRTTSA